MVTCRDVIEETMRGPGGGVAGGGAGTGRTFLAGLSGASPPGSCAVLSDFKALLPVASPPYPFPFSAPPAWVQAGQILYCPHMLNARLCPCDFPNKEWPLTGPSVPPPTGSPSGLSNLSTVWLTTIQPDLVLYSLSSYLSVNHSYLL